MTRRESRAVALAVAVLVQVGAALLLAGTALAAPPASLQGGPVQVRGHTMTLSVFPNGGIAGSARLDIGFLRKGAGGTEKNDYVFVEGVTFKAKRGLSSARLSADLGIFGEIALRFRRSRQAESSVVCRPKFDKSRSGVLQGVFKLKTHTRFFGTVRLHSIPAKLGVGRQRCVSPPRRAGSQFWFGNIGADRDEARKGVSFFAQKLLDGTVTQRYSVWEYSLWKTPRATHTIDVQTTASVFTVSPDFSSARVDGIAPFVTGSADFTATDTGAGVGSIGQTSGTLTGNLEANFDSIGKVRLFSDTPIPGFFAVCERMGCLIALADSTG